MKTVGMVVAGVVLLWWLVSVFGRWQCGRKGHQWFGMHARFQGHVKVACGRCGDVASMTTDQWRQYFAALKHNEQIERLKHGTVEADFTEKSQS